MHAGTHIKFQPTKDKRTNVLLFDHGFFSKILIYWWIEIYELFFGVFHKQWVWKENRQIGEASIRDA